jgi:hypothetical protein
VAARAERRRVDALGRAQRKSQLHVQLWVNRRQPELSEAVLKELGAFPDFPDDARLRWVSSLEEDRFREYYARAYLRALGREDLWSDLRAWWPRRGPQWDALAVVEARWPRHWPGPGRSEVLPARAIQPRERREARESSHYRRMPSRHTQMAQRR